MAAEPLDAVEYICIVCRSFWSWHLRGCVESFPTLNRQSLPIFFRPYLEALVSIMRSIDFQHGKSKKVVLFNCRKVALYLKNIVLLTKHNALVTIPMMTSVLKHIKSFVDVVNKNMDFFKNFCLTARRSLPVFQGSAVVNSSSS